MQRDILATLPLSLNVAFTTALVPAISAAHAKGDNQTINKRISLSLLLCLIIGLPALYCTECLHIQKEILILLFPYIRWSKFVSNNISNYDNICNINSNYQ